MRILGYKLQIILGIVISVFIFVSSISTSAPISYNFPKLDSLFENDLTGVTIDYNPNIPNSEGITIIKDMIGNLGLAPDNDSDLKNDNIITMIQHKEKGFKSLVYVLNRIKRTEDIPFMSSIEWESIVPYIKYIHQYSLDSGEDILISSDFLGLALKINDSNFDSTEYQLGYPNVPIEFLEFLFENLLTDARINNQQTFSLSDIYSPKASNVTVSVEKKLQETVISIVFENISYLFQSSKIDLHEISRFELSLKYLIVQFDKLSFDFSFRKYSYGSNKGVETVTQVTIGNVTNLIINEPLPSKETWLFSSEFIIDEKFHEILPINDTFSWYRSSDIQKRMEMFSGLAISIISSQSFCVLNGTTSLPHELYVDGNLREHTEIIQQSFNVSHSIESYYNDKVVFESIVKGFDFVELKNNEIVPLKTRLMALNQEKGFSGSLLFLEETSLIRDLVSEGFKRFIGKPNITTISNDQFYRLAELYLTTSEYVREDKIPEWNGKQSKVNFIQIGISEFKEISIEKLDQLTSFSPVSFQLLLISIISFKRILYKKRCQKLQDCYSK
ncbi:MAG: hypothetical protein ACTSR2_14220 [Candidatus Hodarchaeales archaeon]